jgi:hypothetical protein
MAIILDDWLGKVHVGLSIMYCFGTMSIVMAIWKWSLFQLFFTAIFNENIFQHIMKAMFQMLMKWEQLA